MINLKIRKILSAFLKFLSVFFPIKNNRIVFKVSNDKYNCNSKYICEYILNHFTNEFDLVYVTADENAQKYLTKKSVKTCRNLSLKYFLYMFTAKFIIVNHNFPEYMPKKEQQILINTWHGGGSYKYLKGEAKNETPVEFEKIDVFISSCISFSNNNLKNRYHINNERIFEIGMPRNDIFFTNFADIVTKVRKKLNIPDNKKIILYVPTYRDFHTNNQIKLDVDKIINACQQKFQSDFVFLTKVHSFCYDEYISNGKSYIININDYDDLQEIICASDIIITDYSSVMWDASFSGHPCFIYAYDLEDYYKIWDFYTPIEEWPFPVGKTIDELVDKILSFDKEEYDNAVKLHHKALGSFETGNACKKTVEYMLSKISN